ncbi:MAG: N-formylglutamate amidohydrolase [Rhodospirillales bacterium]|nr:N-formylglutamate amidohydrolase [Rhodospirillales bacterium]
MLHTHNEDTRKNNRETRLLGATDPAPFTVVNGDSDVPCVLLCDHGGQAVPQNLSCLGLEAGLYDTHHDTHDLGTRAVTEKMAELLGASAIFANYSRLVIDVNRRPEHPTSIVSSIEGYAVSGNADIEDAQRQARITEIYEPYHRQIEALVDRFTSAGTVPLIISIHSYTRQFFKQRRPWDMGVLWVQDARAPLAVIDHFRAQNINVGDNEPYDARILRGTTVNHHGDARKLPNALIEICNDQIVTLVEQEQWAERLVDCLKEILSDPGIHSYYDGPELMHDPDYEKAYLQELRDKATRGDE